MEQFQLEYLRRCIRSHGLDPDEALASYEWTPSGLKKRGDPLISPGQYAILKWTIPILICAHIVPLFPVLFRFLRQSWLKGEKAMYKITHCDYNCSPICERSDPA